MTDVEKQTRIEEIVQLVGESPSSDFYRALWGGERQFSSLPFVTERDFIAVPLSLRTYKREKGLVKIVRREHGSFLVQWGVTDLREEDYRTSCQRPLVLLSNSHEALEKCLWFYEQNTLPLIGDVRNFVASSFMARKAGIDALVSEEENVPRFLEECKKNGPLPPLSLTLLGKEFTRGCVETYVPRFTSLELVLTLPETGPCAYACPTALKEGRTFFHATRNSFLEILHGILVVTKLVASVTPIIRYRTMIVAHPSTDPSCTCGTAGFILQEEKNT